MSTCLVLNWISYDKDINTNHVNTRAYEDARLKCLTENVTVKTEANVDNSIGNENNTVNLTGDDDDDTDERKVAAQQNATAPHDGHNQNEEVGVVLEQSDDFFEAIYGDNFDIPGNN